MASSSSTPIYLCRWDFCSSTFSSSTALRAHLRGHWKHEEPQRVRVKRNRVAPGQWEAIPEEAKLAATLPLRHPGDVTTTTEGTTLSYPYPPSLPSQPPSLPLFLPAEDDADLYDGPFSSQAPAQALHQPQDGRRSSPRSRVSHVRGHRDPGGRAPVVPSSRASTSSHTILEPHQPPLSQESGQLPASQATDYEKIAGIWDTSFDSSSGSKASASSTQGLQQSGSNPPMQTVPERDEWSCFRPHSPEFHTSAATPSPFVPPTQPIPTQVANHSSSHPPAPSFVNPSQMDLVADDAKPDILDTQSSPTSLPSHRSRPSTVKGKPFIPPRSTRPAPPTKTEPSPQRPDHQPLGFGRVPGTTPQASSSLSTIQAAASTPSWLQDPSPKSHQPKPSIGIGQGRPSGSGADSQSGSTSSGSSHQKSDSFSQSKSQFGMPLSQGSDEGKQTEVRRISPAGSSQGVGFSWGQSR